MTLTGTATLVRFMLRRDRVRTAVWVAAIAGMIVAVASSIKDLYPTAADLAAAAATAKENVAVIAMNGPTYAIDTLGGRVAFEVSTIGFVLVSLMSIFTVVRHTRGEEESGRAELIRAAVTGRHAPAAASLVIVTAMNALVGGVVALSLVSMGLPVSGSVVLGAGFALVGMTFAGVAAVAAQVSEYSRASSGMAGAVLGAAFVTRVVGDVGDGTLSWFSPIGWGQAMRAFAGDRWWPALLLLTFSGALVTVAFSLASRRDFGAGLVRPAPGSPVASPLLRHPLGLAFRLQRGAAIGWGTGVFLLGLAYGSLGTDVEDLIGDNKGLSDIVAQGGGSLTEAFFATAALILAFTTAGYAIQSALRLRGEETAGRAEPVLAAVSRARWALSHLTIAVVGCAAILAAGGLGAGGAYAIAAGDAGELPPILGAALAHVPAVWALVGLAAAVFGLLPRATVAVWAALALCLGLGLLGPLLELPAWVVAVSPFEHIPEVPAVELEGAPLAVLTLAAAGLTAFGLGAFRRRDLAT